MSSEIRDRSSEHSPPGAAEHPTPSPSSAASNSPTPSPSPACVPSPSPSPPVGMAESKSTMQRRPSSSKLLGDLLGPDLLEPNAPKPLLDWLGVGLVSLGLAVLALTIAITVDVWKAVFSWKYTMPVAIIGTLAILIASPLTYALSGKRKWGDIFAIWQPFKGGKNFVVMQAFGWSIYGLSLLLCIVVWVLYHVKPETTSTVHGWISMAGACGFISQVIMFGSLWYFEGGATEAEPLPAVPEESEATEAATTEHKEVTEKPVAVAAAVTKPTAETPEVAAPAPAPAPAPAVATPAAAAAPKRGIARIRHAFATMYSSAQQKWPWLFNVSSVMILLWIGEFGLSSVSFLVVFVFYELPLIVISFIVSVAVNMTFSVGMVTLVCLALYSLTYLRSPHTTGRRYWKRFANNCQMFDLMARYFDGKVILDDKDKLDPNGQYFFGFHPHGVFPITMFWVFFGSQWKTFSQKKITPMGATVMMWVPVLRDVLLWSGARDVSYRSLHNCLRDGESVVLVPGGQAEMCETRSGETVTIVTKHKGFVKFALEYGVPLVPVFSFNENKLLDNVSFPQLQKWFLRHIGFVYPLVPFGRFLMPLPRNAPVRVVIGTPIPVPKVPRDKQDEATVNLYHKQYYDQIVQLFEKHKAACNCANYKLRVI